ncbi:MAG: hypothetical protein KGI52_11285 [Burkholderiales bacterium]|nr:hypothetical protein [Burkholderiales bacterium]
MSLEQEEKNMKNDRSKVEVEFGSIFARTDLSAKERLELALKVKTQHRPGGENIRERQMVIHRRMAQLGVSKPRSAALNPYELTEERVYSRYRAFFGNLRVFGLKPLELPDAPTNREELRAYKREAGRRYAAGMVAVEEARKPWDLVGSIVGVSLHKFPLVALPPYPGAFPGAYAEVAGWTVVAREDVDVDWDVYSKAWHRAYGPKRTVSNRRVEARRYGANGELELKTAKLESWRGNWQLNAAVELGLLEEHKGLAHIRLHPAYEVRPTRTVLGYRVYERLLAGEHVDFCVLSPLGATYHATTPAECVAGLRKKLEAVERAKTATITYGFCHKRLGFCETGLKSFARTFGLDVQGAYTPEEIEAKVRSNPTAAAPYAYELRRLAEALGYQTAL